MSGDDGDLLRLLAARVEAQDALTRVFVCADRRDWDGLGAVLGERVVLDYTSLSGGEPAELSGDELLAAWRGALGGFEATQHLLGSFLIETISPSEARLQFYAIATHVLRAGHGDSTWTVAGHYDAVMQRDKAWRLTALTLHLDWSAGNQQLAALAAKGGAT